MKVIKLKSYLRHRYEEGVVNDSLFKPLVELVFGESRTRWKKISECAGRGSYACLGRRQHKHRLFVVYDVVPDPPELLAVKV